ncbi:MAG: hypothetical protein BGP25_10950 [Lysobacterales bacterium 63-13]|nr:MAG: hypothetical protein BGP25_10950 [Xanthomonadales bacterium 63-13]
MNLSPRQRIGIFLVLALVMASTRINHFGALPDASWAVFFVAGFYLRDSLRWVFPLLMALAVLIDFLVINSMGLNFWGHYCMSPAYAFLLVAYAVMWFGGALLQRLHREIGVRSLLLLTTVLVLATSICFVISNGSYYQLSDEVTSPSLAGWFKNMGDWYLGYLRTTLAYVSVAAAAHVIGARWLRVLATAPEVSGNRG